MSLIANALQELESTIPGLFGTDPTQFTWAGNDYVCLHSPMIRGGKPVIAGIALDYGGQIVLRKALFETLPVAGQTGTIDGRTVRIEKVTEAPDFLEIFYINPNR